MGMGGKDHFFFLALPCLSINQAEAQKYSNRGKSSAFGPY